MTLALVSWNLHDCEFLLRFFGSLGSQSGQDRGGDYIHNLRNDIESLQRRTAGENRETNELADRAAKEAASQIRNEPSTAAGTSHSGPLN